MNNLKSQLEALAQQEMDRKTFLKYSGTVILSVVGVTGILKTIVGSHNPSGSAKPQANGGPRAYGASAYGR